ncbi:hypothetical protein SPRG_05425 [Saprolegnia parasitica CBS 223.65]|uniref:Uncharacterized protein n=1 Tax=Saprolegnia parasitica (strain CBS 223.65) TaxID=695850 RepID=A0A067CFE4_SAPPC|nr:hypothetical protein SPRG_05425 [Saprolegnia parasitica CBS 223.65]KDO29183.1 hypothetical protein SPRG_05425 [Saprolegnia parasitica CBS 223.65]|eukprot:XP_012200060.1 hypothetical protein SPRG_05425 [Saprolegnia parasitica CBS 223.65]
MGIESVAWSLPLRVAMAVALAAMLIVNGIHSVSGDMRIVALANPNLLTPSAMFFMLLGPIYASLVGFVGRECYAPNTTIPAMHRVYVCFILSCVCNIMYLSCFVGGYTHVAFAAIFLMWLALFAAYLVVEDSVAPIVVTSMLRSSNANHAFATTSVADVLWIRTPLTLYWAWTCAAATVALNVSLEALGVHAMSIYVFWCGMWVLANTLILLGTGDVPFAFVAFYTLVAIARKSAALSDRLVPQNPNYPEHYAVQVMATVGAFVFGSLFAFLVLHKYWRGDALPRLLAAPSRGAYGSLP